MPGEQHCSLMPGEQHCFLVQEEIHFPVALCKMDYFLRLTYHCLVQSLGAAAMQKWDGAPEVHHKDTCMTIKLTYCKMHSFHVISTRI